MRIRGEAAHQSKMKPPGKRGDERRRLPDEAGSFGNPRERATPAESAQMRDVREIIRRKFSASVATREIARRLGMAPSTVRETL